MKKNGSLIVNGWYLFAHTLFLNQFEDLVNEVENLRMKFPSNFKEKRATKHLAAIQKLIFEKIPQDPALSEYRQGATLGIEYKHWFRAKFFQQYRLFFRYHFESKIIIYAWVNDEDTKRAYGKKSDAYLVFKKMLNSVHPPDDWDELIKECEAFEFL